MTRPDTTDLPAPRVASARGGVAMLADQDAAGTVGGALCLIEHTQHDLSPPPCHCGPQAYSLCAVRQGKSRRAEVVGRANRGWFQVTSLGHRI
jgi:hypothetical protein